MIGDGTVLFMANHGITTVGNTVADAYDRLYYIERAAQVQIYAMWTGQPLKQLPAAVVEKTKRDYGGDQQVRRANAGAAPLRRVEAHARPQGAGIRDVAHRRPCESGTLNHRRQLLAKGISQHRFNRNITSVWVPAFAGTTGWRGLLACPHDPRMQGRP